MVSDIPVEACYRPGGGDENWHCVFDGDGSRIKRAKRRFAPTGVGGGLPMMAVDSCVAVMCFGVN